MYASMPDTITSVMRLAHSVSDTKTVIIPGKISIMPPQVTPTGRGKRQRHLRFGGIGEIGQETEIRLWSEEPNGDNRPFPSPIFIFAATTIVLTPTGTTCCAGSGHVHSKLPEFVPTLAEEGSTHKMAEGDSHTAL
ncbi:hypothetical protein E2C01_065517 [Portunus trituberculatus]|uniref:Uncharacterized protein n=1 Tax=Portunus trituberculatus TaxID=210409 RepID=A0A5B7HNL1_PORTR|nr:hypothetical protein [Portunus trituberculatus]